MSDIFESIEGKINEMLNNETAYSISKGSGVPYQTIQDLKNGKTDMSNARYRNIKVLYAYAVQKNNQP